MSTRTVIEINHDYLYDLEKNPAHLAELLLLLSSGKLANESLWNSELGVPGVRVLGQRHHSETLELKVG